MAYNIFSQPTGPNIDVNLFPSVANQGVDAGNALGTPLSNILEGGLKGYKEGVAIRGELQQQELRQRQIDQLPKQQELDDLKLREARIKVAAEEDAYQQDLQNRSREVEFLEALRNSDPLTQKNLVLGGQYADVFSRNKDLYTQSLQRTLNNPTLNEGEQSQVLLALNKESLLREAGERAQKNREVFSAAKVDLENDTLTKQLATQLKGLTPEQYPDNVQMFPAGKYKVDPSTNRLLKDNLGNLVQDAAYDSKVGSSYVDVFSKDGTRLVEAQDAGSQKVYNSYIKARNEASGEYTRIAIGNLEKQSAPRQQRQSQASPTGPVNLFDDEATTPALESPAVAQAKRVLNLTDDQVTKLDPIIKKLDSTVNSYLNNPTARASIQDSLTADKDALVTSILDDRYTNFERFNQYTDFDVEQYNKTIDENPYSAVLAPFKVQNKRLLFFANQRPYVEAEVDNYILSLWDAQQKNSTLSRQAASSSTASYLSKVAAGGSPRGN